MGSPKHPRSTAHNGARSAHRRGRFSLEALARCGGQQGDRCLIYRGPVGVILFNHSDVDFEVKSGDRIAQLIIEKVVTPEVTEVDDLDSTHRGSGGFGSTGV
ncbi:UNVERIFIED_CONTAM: Deoxyuridine 5'-triphosphate nucleotidohydrolase [Sesamum calycinum]|uniref:dUTP diphosphatase n=1 Tax=Sesamum calycinum TaxID=2727403 RepID=A0AAW2PB65_9LAMI